MVTIYAKFPSYPRKLIVKFRGKKKRLSQYRSRAARNAFDNFMWSDKFDAAWYDFMEFAEKHSSLKRMRILYDIHARLLEGCGYDHPYFPQGDWAYLRFFKEKPIDGVFLLSFFVYVVMRDSAAGELTKRNLHLYMKECEAYLKQGSKF